MAYDVSYLADTDNTVSREGKWFRANQSKSGTPVCHERAFDREADAMTTYPNRPLRTVHIETEFDRMVAAAATVVAPALLAAYAPPAAPPHLLVPPMERVERIAMHGGMQRGERFRPPRPRAYVPRLNPVPDAPLRTPRHGHALRK